jgi:hypothetical protein
MLRNILTRLTTMAPPSAGQKPVTTKPESKADVNPSINALIMKVNKPSVRRFMGSVKMIRIGLMNVFNSPNNADAIIKSPSLLKKIPSNIRLATPSAMAFINQRITAFLNKLNSL